MSAANQLNSSYGRKSIKLRTYQKECIQTCLSVFRIGVPNGGEDNEPIDVQDGGNTTETRTRRRSISVSLETGGGKTFTNSPI
ncbi:unnamed protein product [Ambrosiozyma monospora]|uniref:Unnamed protein product n=1 Tax=Ambrosiozyma monospora TaxID=43982 RepID=A0ACB5U3R1_AMBMO|nr:unnamed protein product [Ambrosiozyma monospora]